GLPLLLRQAFQDALLRLLVQVRVVVHVHQDNHPVFQLALRPRLPDLVVHPRHALQWRHREQLVAAIVDQPHQRLVANVFRWLLVVMNTVLRSTTKLVEVLLERQKVERAAVHEPQYPVRLIERLVERPPYKLALGCPFPQLGEDDALHRAREVRRDDPAMKRRFPLLERQKTLRQTVSVDGLDQIITNPRRRLPRPVPTQERLQRFPTRMEPHLLLMRVITQQRIRPERRLIRRQQLPSLLLLLQRQPTNRFPIDTQHHSLQSARESREASKTLNPARDSATGQQKTPTAHGSAKTVQTSPREHKNLRQGGSYGSAHLLFCCLPPAVSGQSVDVMSRRGSGAHVVLWLAWLRVIV